MGSVLVVGERGSGLTTFLGLLYAAQLRLGTEEQDEFRFSADRETIRQLEAIYGELVAGRFPEWDVDWEANPLSFVFGFRAGRFGRMGGRGIDGDHGFDTVRVQVGGIPADEIAELADHDAVLESSTRRLLRSPVVVLLIDASRLLPPSQDPKKRALARYDRMLTATLRLVGQFLSGERDRKFRTLYPLFVVTKFDQCHPETLADIGAPRESPAAWPSGMREVVGERVLERYLPSTRLFFLGTNVSHSSRVAAQLWFYSSLQLQPASIPPRILRRSRVPLGGWEPEYPFEEYRILIEHLAKLSHRLPAQKENA